MKSTVSFGTHHPADARWTSLADGAASRVAVQRSDFRRLLLSRGGALALANSPASKSRHLSDGIVERTISRRPESDLWPTGAVARWVDISNDGDASLRRSCQRALR